MGSQTFDCRLEEEMDSIEKVRALIKENKLIDDGDKVVIGISGGADSVCLLLLLKDILNSDNIIAVHINHGIRGEEADRDENFVKILCAKYNIRLEIRHLNVPLFAKENKMSEEEAGRVLRYETFEKIRKEEKASKIAVAHNMNDAAETFLLNLSRGSGITGLTGIKTKNENIIRPLIKTSREEIEKIVAFYEEGFITDSTNHLLIYARNRIRNEILPRLGEVNEGVIKHINEAADKLNKIETYIEEESGKAYEKYVAVGDNIFIKDDIMTIAEVITEEIIHKAVIKIAGKARDISGVHISSVKELFLKPVGKKINLPHGVKVYRDYDGIRLLKNDRLTKENKNTLMLPKLKLSSFEIGKISDISIEGNNIELTLTDGSIKNLLQNSCIKWFDYDRISNNVLLRYRKDGDYLIISDEGTRKKLKKYFIDNKVPSKMRDSIPLVAAENEILWIVGYRTGEGAKITKATKKILKMEISDYGGKDGN